MSNPIVYKGCLIYRTDVAHSPTGKPLFGVSGRLEKGPARPFLTSARQAKAWITGHDLEAPTHPLYRPVVTPQGRYQTAAAAAAAHGISRQAASRQRRHGHRRLALRGRLDMAQPTEAEIKASPTLTWLRDNRQDLTRENYIAMATFGQDDYDWTAEDEAGMPWPRCATTMPWSGSAPNVRPSAHTTLACAARRFPGWRSA